MTKSQRLAKLMISVFEKDAWYGPSIMEVLSKVKPEDAFKKIGDSNNVIQLVGHMTAWRTFVIKKLEGDNDFDINTDEINFPNSTDWVATLDALKASQTRLVSLLETIDEKKFSESVSGRSYNFHTLVHGIIQHDIYHLGQIQLIFKYA